MIPCFRFRKLKYKQRKANYFNKFSPERIPETTYYNTLLVTFDVTRLYINIPHDFGLQARRFLIEKYSELTPRNFTLEFILNSIQLVYTGKQHISL